MIIKVILCLGLMQAVLLSQPDFDRDKLFEQFMGLKTEKPTNEQSAIKCNFGINNSVLMNFDKFTIEQQRLMKPMFDRPVLQQSMVSPSGFFRIHFNTTGTTAIQYDIQAFARAADSSYAFEVGYLGFLPPPSDDTAGGDNLYDIYITDTDNSYGVTNFSLATNEKGPSYIEQHYAFGTGFYTHGIEAAKATIAHEFHHAIQLGNYFYKPIDIWFYELTSTSMEEFVFTTVNDYYNYMPHYFSRPDKPIYQTNVHPFDAYDMAIWNIYLVKKYGFGILLEQWQNFASEPQRRALQAINRSLGTGERNSTLTSGLNEFGIWCYYSGKKAIPGQYFDEAASYPLLVPNYTAAFTPPQIPPLSKFSNYAANNFLRFIYTRNNDSDTLISVISNGDYESAISGASQIAFELNLYNSPKAGTRNIKNLFYISFSAARESFWMDSEILNDSVQGSTSFISDADYVYPNPFRYTNNSFVFVPVSPNLTGEVDLSIFTISMDLVYTSTKFITKPYGQSVVKWDGKSSGNERLASGVYIYVAKSGDTVSKGKIVIFND